MIGAARSGLLAEVRTPRPDSRRAGSFDSRRQAEDNRRSDRDGHHETPPRQDSHPGCRDGKATPAAAISGDLAGLTHHHPTNTADSRQQQIFRQTIGGSRGLATHRSPHVLRSLSAAWRLAPAGERPITIVRRIPSCPTFMSTERWRSPAPRYPPNWSA